MREREVKQLRREIEVRWFIPHLVSIRATVPKSHFNDTIFVTKRNGGGVGDSACLKTHVFYGKKKSIDCIGVQRSHND